MISMTMIIIKKKKEIVFYLKLYMYLTTQKLFFQECGNNVQISEEISSLNSETYI